MVNVEAGGEFPPSWIYRPPSVILDWYLYCFAMSVSSPAMKGPLAPIQRWILVGWTVVAVATTALALITRGDADGWGDLVAVLSVMFLIVALGGLGVVALVARYALAGHTWRTLTVALGPPLLLGLAILITRVS